MVQEHAVAASHQEFPHLLGLIRGVFGASPVADFLLVYESSIYSALVIVLLGGIAYLATRKRSLAPGRLQNVAEFYVTLVDDFVCGMLGSRGRKYTPFIGTIFIYILTMNLIGLVPFFKSPTADWSNTIGLSLIVFGYVLFTSFKEFGVAGYFDHHMGKPRGILAWTILLPFFLFMVSIHMMGELIRPLTLSLRLRCNIMAEEQLLVVFANFGGLAGFLSGVVVYFFDILGAVIQAFVFSLLTLVYFSLAMVSEHEHH